MGRGSSQKPRQRGKRAGKKVRDRQQAAKVRSERAEQISDSELPPSPTPQSPSSESERSGGLQLRERARSRSPIRRATPSQAPYVKGNPSPKAPFPAARAPAPSIGSSSTSAKFKAAERVAAGAEVLSQSVEPAADWTIQEITFISPAGDLRKVKYDSNTGLPIIEEEVEEPEEVVVTKKKSKPAPPTRPPAKPPKPPSSRPVTAFQPNQKRNPLPRRKAEPQPREQLYPGKRPASQPENPALNRRELLAHLKSQGVRGTALDQTVLQETKSNCTTCADRRQVGIPRAAKFATARNWVKKRKTWQVVEKPKAEPIPTGAPPPPKREASSSDSERQAFSVGIDFGNTLDNEIIDRNGEPLPAEVRAAFHSKLVQARRKTGAIFYLHSFSGKTTGYRTIGHVEAWEKECEAASGGRVFDELNFHYSILRNKFGKSGKAKTAKARGYQVIFDDDLRVCQESEGLGIESYLIAGYQGYESLSHAVEDFVRNYS